MKKVLLLVRRKTVSGRLFIKVKKVLSAVVAAFLALGSLTACNSAGAKGNDKHPTGASGTSLLPDSQIDRFMIRLSIGYPSAKDEKAMIESRKNGLNPMDNVKTVCDVNTILQMQAEVNNVFMHDNVTDYIVTLINKTRGHKNLIRGGSPRATLALTSMAKACAYLNGRNYVR